MCSDCGPGFICPPGSSVRLKASCDEGTYLPAGTVIQNKDDCAVCPPGSSTPTRFEPAIFPPRRFLVVGAGMEGSFSTHVRGIACSVCALPRGPQSLLQPRPPSERLQSRRISSQHATGGHHSPAIAILAFTLQPGAPLTALAAAAARSSQRRTRRLAMRAFPEGCHGRSLTRDTALSPDCAG